MTIYHGLYLENPSPIYTENIGWKQPKGISLGMTDGGLSICIQTVQHGCLQAYSHLLTRLDLSLEAQDALREHSPNSAKYFDGDILRQIRILTKRGLTTRREAWLSRLSTSKQDCVLRFENSPKEVVNALDDLIPFVGLWPALKIGTFPRLLSLHCYEV